MFFHGIFVYVKNMTAIVGVLNRHAVAIAADSAVTMGNTHKVVNSANKIFTLSKYHPVAVMTYNNASFMGVPWDIIIKEYRKQLGELSFPCLDDYRKDFIAFLHKRKFFCDDKTQLQYLIEAISIFDKICRTEICREKNIKPTELTNDFIKVKLKEYQSYYGGIERCPEFKEYSFDNFMEYAGKEIQKYAQDMNFDSYTLLAETFYSYFFSIVSDISYTGLVFVGYGENEIYPSLTSIVLSMGIDDHLTYYVKEVAKIEEHGPGAIIIPFAQVDVTQTIVRGINPNFQSIIYNVICNTITRFFKDITDIIDKKPGNEDLSSVIKSLNVQRIIEDATNRINKGMREGYTDPLLNTVVNLDKEDMANMAESFISLTSLVRRMQPGEETVGGPVDVAVISKGDGFIWINRKHYFKPELNTHFFNNYFK